MEGGYRAAGRFGTTVRRREEYLGCPCWHANPHFRSHEPGLQYFSPAACIYKSFVVQNSIWNGRVLNKPLRARGLEGPGGRASQSLAPGRGGPSFSELSFWKVFSRSSPEHSRGTWLPVGPTATERSLRLGGLSKGSVIPRLVQGPRKDRFLSRPLKRFLIGGPVVPPKVEEIMPVAST